MTIEPIPPSNLSCCHLALAICMVGKASNFVASFYSMLPLGISYLHNG